MVFTPPIDDQAWARAFALQSIADLDTRDILSSTTSPKCHRLHFLQMSAEKLCKAFLIQANGLDHLTFKHCVIAKILPVVLRGVLISKGQTRAKIESQSQTIRHLSLQIELLSPSCPSAGTSLSNVEYPWLDNGRIFTPSTYSFPNLADESRSLISMTKLMRSAAETYLA